MDTLKSYFTKMKLLPGHGHRGWRLSRKGSEDKSGPKAKYSRSKSQNDAAFETNMAIEALNCKENHVDKNGTLTSNSSRDSARQAPAKPPRRDHIFMVEFSLGEDNKLGIMLDTVSNTCFNDLSVVGSPISHDTSMEELSYRTICPIKVVDIEKGSKVEGDGQIQVLDEVMDINGHSLQGVSISDARYMIKMTNSLDPDEMLHNAASHLDPNCLHRNILDEAIQTSHVVMKVRRKRKRQAPNPPTPKNSQKSPYTSSSSSNLLQSTTAEQSLSEQGTMSHSTTYLDSSDCYNSSYNQFHFNSLNVSDTSLTASNDDVFTNSVTDVNLAPKKFPSLQASVPSPKHTKRGVYLNGQSDLYQNEKFRTQSASAVEDIYSWENNSSQNLDYVNTAELARQGNYGILTQVSINSESDINAYQSDTELQLCNRSDKHHKSLRSLDAFRQANNHTPVSLCSFDEGSEYDLSCNSSPSVAKRKRIITKLHLLKENNSFGLHIAGGRGSKRGDIGIFVAGITENGPTHRDGRLRRGDEILMINGKSLIGLTHAEAVEVLRNAPKLVQMVIARKVRKSSSLVSSSSNFTPLSPVSPNCTGNQPAVPEVMAHTPQGTIVNWEELFDKFSTAGVENKPPSGASSNNRYAKRRGRSQSPMFLPPLVITVQKGLKGKGLGFTIVGGSDTPLGSRGVLVRRIFQHGLIAEDGRIREGDEVTELNGEALAGLTHKDVITRFRKLKKGPVTITFRKRLQQSPHCSPARSPYLTPAASCDGSPVSTPGHSPHSSMSDLHDLDLHDSTASSDIEAHPGDHRPTFSVPVNIPRTTKTTNMPIGERLSPDVKPKLQHEIQLVKEAGVGLGISVIRKTYDGASEILVQDISHNSPAYKDGRLRKGDMIVEVNERKLTNTTLLDAYQLFRNLQPGTVELVIRRKDKLQKIHVTLPDSDSSCESLGYLPSPDSFESDLPCSECALEDGDDVTNLHTDFVVKKELLRKRLSTVSEESGSLV